MSSTEQVPVAIVGGGVVGVTLALMLARRGIATVVFERELEPHRLPRAHAVNPRTIEVLGEIGISDTELRRVGAPKDLTSEVRFATTLTGHCFGTLPYERQDDDVRDVTPSPLVNIPQPALEALLLDRVASEPLIDLRRDHAGCRPSRRGREWSRWCARPRAPRRSSRVIWWRPTARRAAFANSSG